MAKRSTIFKRNHAIAIIMFILLMCIPLFGCGGIDDVRTESVNEIVGYKEYKLSTYYYGDDDLARLDKIVNEAVARIKSSNNEKTIKNITSEAKYEISAVPNIGMRAKLYTLQEAYDQKIISKSTLTDLAERLNHARWIDVNEMDPYLLASANCWVYVSRYKDEEGLQNVIDDSLYGFYYGECSEPGDTNKKYCFTIYTVMAVDTEELIDGVRFVYHGYARIAVI